MRQVWSDIGNCTLDGVPFEYASGGYKEIRTTDEKVWVLKPKSFFDQYDKYLSERPPTRLLELGIFEGGSALLFADKWPNAKISGVDKRPANEAVQRHIDRFGFADRVKLHYDTSQDDADALRRIMDEDLGGSPDVVIDDASHLYPLTRRTFEIVFPRLTPGGLYIIEDWAWAHWDDWQRKDHIWAGHQALSNLAFELMMMAGTQFGMIAEMCVNRSLIAIRKGGGAVPDDFKLEDHYIARGKELNKI